MVSYSPFPVLTITPGNAPSPGSFSQGPRQPKPLEEGAGRMEKNEYEAKGPLYPSGDPPPVGRFTYLTINQQGPWTAESRQAATMQEELEERLEVEEARTRDLSDRSGSLCQSMVVFAFLVFFVFLWGVGTGHYFVALYAGLVSASLLVRALVDG